MTGVEMATDQTYQKLVETLQRSLLCNILLVDALFELLVKKEILAGDEVIEHIKRLRLEASKQIQQVQ
jgi:hypothetical protein